MTNTMGGWGLDEDEKTTFGIQLGIVGGHGTGTDKAEEDSHGTCNFVSSGETRGKRKAEQGLARLEPRGGLRS
jgi:hypothetical protein